MGHCVVQEVIGFEPEFLQALTLSVCPNSLTIYIHDERGFPPGLDANTGGDMLTLG